MCEFVSHKYVFDRQDRRVEMLEKVTLDEFRAFFEDYFFGNSGKGLRLDLHWNSQKHLRESTMSQVSQTDSTQAASSISEECKDGE